MEDKIPNNYNEVNQKINYIMQNLPKIKDELNKELNKTDNIVQNDEYDKFIDDICAYIFASLIIGYTFISWFIAILLLIYNFILSPSERSFLLSFLLGNQNNMYQFYTIIPIPLFIKIELILILPPAILLGLIYYPSKKNHDE